MVDLLGLVLIAFLVTSALLIPFIDALFYLRRKYKHSFPFSDEKDKRNQTNVEFLNIDKNTPIHNKLLQGKDVDTPVGGGLLLIPILVIISLAIFFWTNKVLNIEAFILILTLLSFGYIGLLDDLRKIFTAFSGKFAGLRGRYILILQTIFALIIAYLMYNFLGFNNVFIPHFGNIVLGFWYVPLAAIPIVAFANAYNISDGLDGLSTGLLTICLIAFLVLAHAVFDVTLSVFVGIWLGTLIAYLYFNVFPARIYLGDAGAFGFGATLAVVGLLTGKIVGLGIIGAVYVVIVGSSLLQIASKRFLGRKLFPVAPIHMYFKYIGWPEPKIVARFWLAGAIFAILGLWLSLLSK